MHVGLSRSTLVAVAILGAAVPACARAQTVDGNVLDSLTARPLRAAEVGLFDSLGAVVNQAVTDSTGRFFLRAPRPGRYRVQVDQFGYESRVTDTLAVSEAGLHLLLRMSPIPIPLDSVEVFVQRGAAVRLEDAKLRKVGFYRRTASVGYLLDPDKVRDLRPHYASDLLRQIPRVLLRPAPGIGYVPLLRSRLIQGVASAQATTGTIRGCVMKVVLDGQTLPLDEGFYLDDMVPAQDVLAMEVYPNMGGAGAPIQYRGPDAYCGVIVIWTKLR